MKSAATVSTTPSTRASSTSPILDTVGHGLNSAVLAALLVGAYRHGRRAGDDFANLATRMDAAARTFPAELAFATAILVDLTPHSARWTG